LVRVLSLRHLAHVRHLVTACRVVDAKWEPSISEIPRADFTNNQTRFQTRPHKIHLKATLSDASANGKVCANVRREQSAQQSADRARHLSTQAGRQACVEARTGLADTAVRKEMAHNRTTDLQSPFRSALPFWKSPMLSCPSANVGWKSTVDPSDQRHCRNMRCNPHYKM